MNGIVPMRDDRDVKTLSDGAHDNDTPFAIIFPRVVLKHGGIPIEVRHKLRTAGRVPRYSGRSLPGRT
jgi:hypothetical protein